MPLTIGAAAGDAQQHGDTAPLRIGDQQVGGDLGNKQETIERQTAKQPQPVGIAGHHSLHAFLRNKGDVADCAGDH